MAEEQQGTIKKSLIRDEEEERDLMLPEPQTEQDVLWEKLDAIVKEPDLEREMKWMRTPQEIRVYLASDDLSKRMRKIGERFGLNAIQLQELARIIRYVFMGEIPVKDTIGAIFEKVKVERKIAPQVAEEIKSSVFIPQKAFLTRSPAGTPVASQPISRPQVVPPPTRVAASPMSTSPILNSIIPQKPSQVDAIRVAPRAEQIVSKPVFSPAPIGPSSPANVPPPTATQKTLPSSWEEKFKTVIQQETSKDALASRPRSASEIGAPMSPKTDVEKEFKFKIEPQYSKTALGRLREFESASSPFRRESENEKKIAPAPKPLSVAEKPASQLVSSDGPASDGVHLDDLYNQVKQTESAVDEDAAKEQPASSSSAPLADDTKQTLSSAERADLPEARATLKSFMRTMKNDMEEKVGRKT